MAYEYAKMGARLALVARRKEKLEGVAATARGFGSPDVLVLRADVSDVNDCRRSIDETIHHFDRRKGFFPILFFFLEIYYLIMANIENYVD